MDSEFSINDEIFSDDNISSHSLDPKIIENDIKLSKPSLCTNNSTTTISSN